MSSKTNMVKSYCQGVSLGFKATRFLSHFENLPYMKFHFITIKRPFLLSQVQENYRFWRKFVSFHQTSRFIYFQKTRYQFTMKAFKTFNYFYFLPTDYFCRGLERPSILLFPILQFHLKELSSVSISNLHALLIEFQDR